MKKDKFEIQQKTLTVFDIPSDEAKKYLSSIIRDVGVIINTPSFIEATRKVKLPEDATIKDFEELITRTVPSKIYSFLNLFINDCYDEVRKVLSALFITDYEIYKKKSLNAMCEDLARMDKKYLREFLGFFIR